jgi:hypothetical protein
LGGASEEEQRDVGKEKEGAETREGVLGPVDAVLVSRPWNGR